MDLYVKIGRFRIELGEIEAMLATHPGVSRCAVIVHTEEAGAQLMAAYVALGDSIDPRELGRHVRLSLPGYMMPALFVPLADLPLSPNGKVDRTALEVGGLRNALKQLRPECNVPSAFVVLEALPLTANGKIDRRALPAPEESRGKAGYVAPRTPTEEVMAAIWSDVLRLDQVGVYDNFFELGGHSLLVMRMMARVRDSFGVEVPLRTLFEAPALSELCKRIDLICWVVQPRELGQIAYVDGVIGQKGLKKFFEDAAG